MKLRTVALALALSMGFTAAVEAKSKPVSHARKTKKYKQPKAPKYKARKVKRA